MKKLLASMAGLLILIGACKVQEQEQAQEPPAAGSSGTAMAAESGRLEWLAYDKGLAAGKDKNKPIFVEFYADWCPYCKKLDNEVLADPTVQAQLKKDFIAVKVNGESQRKISFRGAPLSEQELTALHGVRGYPALFFLEPKGDVIGSIPGFVEAKELKSLMAFISSNSHKKMKYQDYVKQTK